MLGPLIEATRRLPDPRNYYVGTPNRDALLPHNVILFRRTNRRFLGPLKAYHHRFVLVTSCAGAGSVIIDDRSFRLTPGMSVLIFPHQFHHFMDIANEDLAWLFVTFEHTSPDYCRPLRSMPVQLSPPAVDTLVRLSATYRPPRRAGPTDTDRTVMLTGLALNELLQSVSDHPPVRRRLPRAEHDTRIDHINTFVARHLDSPLPLADLARRFALSESHLRLLYRRVTGMSLGSYISRMRINRASGLLLNSEMQVTEVAHECGYDTVYSFSRAFKRAVGVSPRRYRNRLTAPRHASHIEHR